MSGKEILDLESRWEIRFPLDILISFSSCCGAFTQREVIHQTVRAALWHLPVDFQLMMFEIQSVVLFSVHAIALIVVYLLLHSTSGLAVFIDWLIGLFTFKHFFPMHPAQGNHSMHCSVAQNPAEGKYSVHSCTRWSFQNQCSFILSSHSPTTLIFLLKRLKKLLHCSYCKKCKMHHKKCKMHHKRHH